MGRGNVGWVEVGDGFLDFCCRKKPPVRGRAERGRVSEQRGCKGELGQGLGQQGPPGGEEGGRVDG